MHSKNHRIKPQKETAESPPNIIPLRADHSPSDTSEPGFLRLLALVAATLTVAAVVAMPVVYLMAAVTPPAPQKAVVAVPAPSIAPIVSRPPAAAPARPAWLVRLDLARERNAARRLGKQRRRAR